MLNYNNLNDLEFEYLCQDIMSRKLNTNLRIFSQGRDKGIDLTNDVTTNEIVVQVKNYKESSVSTLISHLKKEVCKLSNLNCQKYYVCCPKKLTASNIKDIYNIFSDYMENDSHIITLIEIDNFLNQEVNKDILRKNYKLWLSSSEILSQIYNNDIFIDSEVLLYDIKNQIKLFVETSAYTDSLQILENHRVLFITGEPGIGKTTLSKMIIMHFATNQYKVRYTTDGQSLADLKKSLSQNRDVKEIILLDDCFGQIYFNMKESQSNEIISLIKYINMNPNKILVLNSRVTIFKEATHQNSQLLTSFNNKEYSVQILDMNNISILEKAKILYNHVYFKTNNETLLKTIKESKNYLKIIEHPNYNPRIIEFICNADYSKLNTKNCFDFIMTKFNNPGDIWEDEYERKLSKVDRLLITTIYSLTQTTESYEYIKNIFNKRIENFSDIDITKDNFANSLKRLQGSILKVIDVNEKSMISMINPSVNDFLNSKIINNSPEYNEIINNATSIRQLQRLLPEEIFKEKIHAIFSEHLIDNYIFPSDDIKSSYITWYISHNNIFDNYYQNYIFSYFDNPTHHHIYYNNHISISKVLKLLFSDRYSDYYDIITYFDSFEKLESLLQSLDLPDLIDIIALIYKWYNEYEYNFLDLIEYALDYYLDCIDLSEYDIDMHSFINDNTTETEYGEQIDIDTIVDSVYQHVKDLIDDEIYEILNKLPNDFNKKTLLKKVNIDHLDIYEFVELKINSFKDDPYGYTKTASDSSMYTEIDHMFN